MIAQFTLSHDYLETWGERMFAASWQGGLLLVMAWLICRFWKQLPASTRCWIWRIAFFKFAVVLLFGGLLQLPILPSSFGEGSNVVVRSANNGQPVDPKNDRGAIIDNEHPIVAFESAAQSPGELTGVSEVNNEQAAAPSVEEDPAVVPAAADRTSIVYSILFGIWIVGCLWSLFTVLRHHWIAKQLIGASLPFDDQPFLRRFYVLCAQLKLSRAPRLMRTSEIHSPILVGAIRPTILLPDSVIRSCGPDELSLIVAHELAHAKRRDLIWNWLPVIVRSCFFFHPLVWLAQSRFALDQEIACDYMALNGTRAQCNKYGNVLVKVSAKLTADRTPTLAALGVASSFKTLKSRILEMNQFKYQTSPISQLLSISIVAMALLTIVPLDLVAQQEKKIRKERGGATIERTDEQENKSRSGNSASVTTDENRVVAKSIQDGKTDISVTVNKDGVQQSIEVNSKENGGLDVKYTSVVDGEKEVKKYNLKNIDELAKKNKKAYQFYKDHVNVSGGGKGRRRLSVTTETESPNGTGSGTARSGSGRTGSGTLRRSKRRSVGSGATAGEGTGESSGSSASGGGTGESSSGRAGSNRRRFNSGTTEGSAGGGVINSNRKLIEKINKLIEQTDDSEMKKSLRELRDQIRGK